MMPNYFVQFMNFVNKGSASVVHIRLRGSKGMDPFLDSRECSLSTSVSNWVYHQEAKKGLNNQEAMKVPVTWWVKRSFVIYVVCAKRGCFNLLFFQWDFIPVFGFKFVILVCEAVSSKCTNPIKQTRPVAESFCIVIGFWSTRVPALFIVLSKVETRYEE